MAQPQTVIGFFDSVSEAQQAVQVLLLRGFVKENMYMDTRTDPTITNTPTDEERQTGRFYFSLFGNLDNALIHHDVSRRNGTFVAIYSTSAPEIKLAVTLLKEAGSTAVSDGGSPPSTTDAPPV
jgi:hypothetical protein